MEKAKKIWLDGNIINWEDAKVHVLCHALNYGTGVFEGIRVYNTPKGPAVFRLKDHIKRLMDGCKIMGTKGHTLVIPKLEEPEADYIFDLDDRTLADMMVFAKRVALAMQQVIPCKRIGVAVLGMEVNHVHVHLIPLKKETDMLFSNPKLHLDTAEMATIANSIANAFDGGVN